jgi:hypothetical protein
MNKNESEQPNTDNSKSEPDCGPGCDCETSGLSTKGKVIVCLVIGIVAATVLARGFMKKTKAENDPNQPSFSTDLSALNAKDTTLWGQPLESMNSLGAVAANKDAVFILLPSENKKDVETVKTQIDAAAAKLTAKGTSIGAFILDKNAKDYAEVSKQLPDPPCVLALSKNGGMSVVATDITEAKLLEAIVEASRPSGCGPNGCGPNGCE